MPKFNPSKEEQLKIKIATLNYSGIITSPYEYHED